MLDSSSKYSPSSVTLTPVDTYNGIGVVNTGLWRFGEYSEAMTEWTLPYADHEVTRTYDTKSGVSGLTGSFTASLGVTESIYGITAFATASFRLLFSTLTAAFTTTSFGFGGVENSYMDPVTMSYTNNSVYNGAPAPASLTYRWEFGSASFWTPGLGSINGTTSSVGPHTVADYKLGNYTAFLQATGSYGVTSKGERYFHVDSSEF